MISPAVPPPTALQGSAAAPWGSTFTAHMVCAAYTPERGWKPVTLAPYGPLELEPATSVLHYGQAVFEGLKAYRQPDGGVALFRPDRNALRFARSARRLAMPELPAAAFLDSLRLLVDADRDAVPDELGRSLYLRPLEIATDPALLTVPSRHYLYVLIASSVADYFEHGLHPVRVWLATDHARAMPGGTGEAKCAGNYAGAMLAQQHAVLEGCDQVVWLDSAERRFVEEMGGMNLFFVLAGNRLVTPPLTGTLLPGVTRDSILSLAAELGLQAEERRFSVDEWRTAAAGGSLVEVFACGTAAVVTPVGQVVSDGESFSIADGEPGAITLRVRETLLGIQHGLLPDRHGWMSPVLPRAAVGPGAN